MGVLANIFDMYIRLISYSIFLIFLKKKKEKLYYVFYYFVK